MMPIQKLASEQSRDRRRALEQAAVDQSFQIDNTDVFANEIDGTD